MKDYKENHDKFKDYWYLTDEVDTKVSNNINQNKESKSTKEIKTKQDNMSFTKTMSIVLISLFIFFSLLFLEILNLSLLFIILIPWMVNYLVIGSKETSITLLFFLVPMVFWLSGQRGMGGGLLILYSTVFYYILMIVITIIMSFTVTDSNEEESSKEE